MAQVYIGGGLPAYEVPVVEADTHLPALDVSRLLLPYDVETTPKMAWGKGRLVACINQRKLLPITSAPFVQADRMPGCCMLTLVAGLQFPTAMATWTHDDYATWLSYQFTMARSLKEPNIFVTTAAFQKREEYWLKRIGFEAIFQKVNDNSKNIVTLWVCAINKA
jgi:hypothetical protein